MMASLLKNSKYFKVTKINGGTCRSTVFAEQKRSRVNVASSDDPEEYEYIQRSRVPTMHFQASMPRLPIPKLEDSCKKYLRAQQPILSEKEFSETSSRVSEFLANDGPQLQKRLVDRDSRNKHTSYISEPWFDMYLKDRKPLPINYNPLLIFNPESNPQYENQLVKATNLVVSSARFMKSLRAEILEPEVYHMNPKKSDTDFFRTFTGILPSSLSWYGAYLFKAFPLDMSQYSHLFGTTRIPEIGKDRIIQNNKESRHVVAMRRGHFYSFDILNDKGNIRPAREIASCIKEILDDTREPNQCPVGAFTTTDRDEWAENRRYLLKLGNERVFETIDSAAFVLIFDGEKVADCNHKALKMFLHGNSQNRWFDKSFSLIVAGDGLSGLNFEHSWGDGVAILRYFQDIKKDIERQPRFHPEEVSSLPASSSSLERLNFLVDPTVKEKIDRAVKQYDEWIEQLSLDWVINDNLGRVECKKFGVSPDALMQVALQLALYKLEGRSVATYESCSTAAFKHGRTETVRSCTNETKALCSAIVGRDKSGVSTSELKKLMLACSAAHGNLIKEAAMGHGFDRHLFALRNMWESSENSGPTPSIFKDPAYAKLNHNILSTSTLSSPQLKAGGFGPTVPDGYGIGYRIEEHSLGTVVTSYKKHRDAKEYVDSLRSAVRDIHEILKSS